LIIDTRKSCLFGEFSDFFTPVNACIKVETNTTKIDIAINSLDCYPPLTNGPQVNELLEVNRTIYSKEHGNLVDRVSGAYLTFDFEKDYSESILVHEQFGGGNLSFGLLERITISENIRSFVLHRIARLDKDYVAIHVRNTDYRTNFESLFNTIYPKVAGKSVLICSDDAEVIAKAKNYFNASKVLTASDIPHTNQKPLHHEWTMKADEDRKKAAINSIVDLCALGLSGKLYFMDVTAGHPSGFSRLAGHLHENKHLVLKLLQITHTDFMSRQPRHHLAQV